MIQSCAEIDSEILIVQYARGCESTMHEIRQRVARALASIDDVDDYPSIHCCLEGVLRERIIQIGPQHWTLFTTLLNLLKWLLTLKLPLSAPTVEARSPAFSIPHPSLRPPVRAPPAVAL